MMTGEDRSFPTAKTSSRREVAHEEGTIPRREQHVVGGRTARRTGAIGGPLGTVGGSWPDDQGSQMLSSSLEDGLLPCPF